MTSAKSGEVSQKLTKVDRGEGILSKADVSQLSNFYDQNYDIRPLGALSALYERAPKLTNIFKSYIFSNFHLSYWTYLPKNMFLWPKLWLSFVPQNICLHQPVLKSWCQPGGEGGIFCQKLTEADKGGGGVKIDQILADVICEPSLTITCPLYVKYSCSYISIVLYFFISIVKNTNCASCIFYFIPFFKGSQIHIHKIKGF